MIPNNTVMKFHNFDIFYKVGYIFDLSSALACRMESLNTGNNVNIAMQTSPYKYRVQKHIRAKLLWHIKQNSWWTH